MHRHRWNVAGTRPEGSSRTCLTCGETQYKRRNRWAALETSTPELEAVIGKRSALRAFPREDGEQHRSRVAGTTGCRRCGKAIPLREEGRQREFCGPACRVAYHRAARDSLVLRALAGGPLYRGALELVIGRGDLTRELRRLHHSGLIAVAADVGPATWRLTPAGELELGRAR